jgi:HK97 family phage prohead protease
MIYKGRAYSLLTCKAVDDARRIISGIASTPTVDRIGDSVNPLGARFKTPMPLLLFHDTTQPVGSVDFAKPTKTGIPFEASLPIVSEPGVVQTRVNEALHSLKYKLLACVSIGFRAMEDGVELLKTGGLLFNEYEWMELSLCSVPANPEAVIQGFRSMDADAINRALGTRQANTDSAREALIQQIKSADQAARRATHGAPSARFVRPNAGKSGSPDASGTKRPAPRRVFFPEQRKDQEHENPSATDRRAHAEIRALDRACGPARRRKAQIHR